MKILYWGVEAYHSEQRQKLEILKFLLDHYNDGRRKGFSCLAVNLLDLEDWKIKVGKIKSRYDRGYKVEETASREFMENRL